MFRKNGRKSFEKGRIRIFEFLLPMLVGFRQISPKFYSRLGFYAPIKAILSQFGKISVNFGGISAQKGSRNQIRRFLLLPKFQKWQIVQNVWKIVQDTKDFLSVHPKTNYIENSTEFETNLHSLFVVIINCFRRIHLLFRAQPLQSTINRRKTNSVRERKKKNKQYGSVNSRFAIQQKLFQLFRWWFLCCLKQQFSGPIHIQK
jgi:hypothetical protein